MYFMYFLVFLRLSSTVPEAVLSNSSSPGMKSSLMVGGLYWSHINQLRPSLSVFSSTINLNYKLFLQLQLNIFRFGISSSFFHLMWTTGTARSTACPASCVNNVYFDSSIHDSALMTVFVRSLIDGCCLMASIINNRVSLSIWPRQLSTLGSFCLFINTPLYLFHGTTSCVTVHDTFPAAV